MDFSYAFHTSFEQTVPESGTAGTRAARGRAGRRFGAVCPATCFHPRLQNGAENAIWGLMASGGMLCPAQIESVRLEPGESKMLRVGTAPKLPPSITTCSRKQLPPQQQCYRLLAGGRGNIPTAFNRIQVHWPQRASGHRELSAVSQLCCIQRRCFQSWG